MFIFEEITVHYSDGYFKEAKLPSRRGSKNCRGKESGVAAAASS